MSSARRLAVGSMPLLACRLAMLSLFMILLVSVPLTARRFAVPLLSLFMILLVSVSMPLTTSRFAMPLLQLFMMLLVSVSLPLTASRFAMPLLSLFMILVVSVSTPLTAMPIVVGLMPTVVGLLSLGTSPLIHVVGFLERIVQRGVRVLGCIVARSLLGKHLLFRALTSETKTGSTFGLQSKARKRFGLCTTIRLYPDSKSIHSKTDPDQQMQSRLRHRLCLRRTPRKGTHNIRRPSLDSKMAVSNWRHGYPLSWGGCLLAPKRPGCPQGPTGSFWGKHPPL